MLKSTEPPRTIRPATTTAVVPPRSQPLRVWPAIVMLTVFWVFLVAHYTFEMDMFPRFISRMIAYGLLLIGFLGWWLTRRQISRRDRFLAIGIVILSSVIAGLVADKSVDLFVLFMSAFPFVFTAWALWIVVSRHRSISLQRVGFVVVIALVTGFFALLRWEGLYGNQIPQFSWRWTKSAEELFLASSNDEQAAAITNRLPAPSQRDWTLQPGDWPEFRGPNRDGVVSGVKLESDWNTNLPELVWWKRVGPAWSSMIVVDGFLVTQEQRGDVETVVCYEADNGREVWTHADEGRFFEGLSGAGPRGTPTFAGGRIYALGGNGRLVCLSAADGKLLWSRDVVAEADAKLPMWGCSASPLVVDGKAIVFAGERGAQSLRAYDAATGKPQWAQAAGKLSYSSPQLVTIDGERQLLMHVDQALLAVSIDNGAVLWERPSSTETAMPMLQPHTLNDGKLLIAADPGVTLLDVQKQFGQWTLVDHWASKSLKPSFNDFVVYEDHIYGLDDGILTCVDLETGQRIWKKGRYGHGQILLLADQGLLLVLSEKGEVVLVAANAERLDERGRFQAIEGKTWNHPVLSRGRLFVRNGEEMACYQLKLADAP